MDEAERRNPGLALAGLLPRRRGAWATSIAAGDEAATRVAAQLRTGERTGGH